MMTLLACAHCLALSPSASLHVARLPLPRMTLVAAAEPQEDVLEPSRRLAEQRRLEAENARSFDLVRRRKFGFSASKNFIRNRPLTRKNSKVYAKPEFTAACEELRFADGAAAAASGSVGSAGSSEQGEGSGFWFAELSHNEEIVGRLTFIIDSPGEDIQVMQHMLQVSAAEFKNLDVVPSYRGFLGGDILMLQVLTDMLCVPYLLQPRSKRRTPLTPPAVAAPQMTEILEERNIQFVLLKHLDRGSGKLITYYEHLGFEFAREVLPIDKVRLQRARRPSRARCDSSMRVVHCPCDSSTAWRRCWTLTTW